MTVDVIWKSLPLNRVELSLSRVLRCGQTFRWKNIDQVWSFAISDRIVLLKQDDEKLHYSWIMKESLSDGPANAANQNSQQSQEESTLSFIKDYFALSTNLEKLYKQWHSVDEQFKRKLGSPFINFPGIRILRQDPWETVVSFICSSNNNVKRISKMCDSLCNDFGDYINDYKGVSFYSFPSPEKLAQPGTEQKLRDLGFGYRAKYIYNTARMLTGDEYPDITVEKLYQMRDAPFEDAHEFLLQLNGVGPKVADCICLMALDKHDTVPVDTHVYQIAIRDFKFKGKKDLKTMNKQVYEDIREFFKQLFGSHAGWAQSVLFASDLSDLNNGVNIKEESETTVKIETQVVDKKRCQDSSSTTITKRSRKVTVRAE